MSRPALPAQRRRCCHVVFRLTEAEHAALVETARQAGVPVNELARRLALSRRDRLALHTSRRVDPALIAEIRRVGNNLNQLVHNAHIFGRLSPKIEALCERIGALVQRAAEETVSE